MPVPYVIYADFEALIKPIENTNHSKTDSSYTYKTQEHIPCGFGYIVVRYDGKTNPPVIYRGPDAAGKFLEYLQNEERIIREKLSCKIPMRMTRDDWRAHKKSTSCHVCNKPLNGDSVRDHCHVTVNYQGAANNECNFKLEINSQTIPISSNHARFF